MAVCNKHGSPITYTSKECPACEDWERKDEEPPEPTICPVPIGKVWPKMGKGD